MVSKKLPSFPYYLLPWVLLISIQVSRGDDTMELGSVLTPSSPPLQSPSFAFVLSFRPPPATSSNASSSTNLYLAVSFAFSLEGPPAWVAERDRALSSSANLTLLSNGDLSLSDASLSPSPIWSSQTSNMGVVQLQLLDSGNLVLLNKKSEYVWQSFLSPTDTLLPNQNFTNFSSTLRSNERAGLFDRGSYTLGADSSTGFLKLSSTVQPEGYWNDIWGNLTWFQFDHVKSSITMHGSSSFIIESAINASAYRLTLDVDGNLRMYAWDTASANWKSIWMAFSDVCDRILGLCGEYGVCVYNPQPTCVCPQGFSVKDPTLLSSGCNRNFAINDCSIAVKYAELENTDFPFGDYIDFTDLSINECKALCLNSCSCMAAVYVDATVYGHCWLKAIVSNGRYVGSQKHKVFLKVSNSEPSVVSSIQDTTASWSFQSLFPGPSANPSNTVESKKANPAVTLFLSALVGVLALCLAGACMILLKSRKKLTYMRIQKDLEAVSRSPDSFSY